MEENLIVPTAAAVGRVQRYNTVDSSPMHIATIHHHATCTKEPRHPAPHLAKLAGHLLSTCNRGKVCRVYENLNIAIVVGDAAKHMDGSGDIGPTYTAASGAASKTAIKVLLTLQTHILHRAEGTAVTGLNHVLGHVE